MPLLGGVFLAGVPEGGDMKKRNFSEFCVPLLHG